MKGVEYKMRSVPLKPGEKVNEEPPRSGSTRRTTSTTGSGRG